MGIVTLVKMTRNMPRKLADATLQAHGYQLNEPTISANEYFSMMKRMEELEEKVITLSNKPNALPPEKEELLNNAMKRIDTLEQHLCATHKVLFHYLFKASEQIRNLMDCIYTTKNRN